MNTFENDVNKIHSKLRKARGEDIGNKDIAFIETLAGRYDGVNVLEGWK